MEQRPEWLMPVLRYCHLEEFAEDEGVVSDVMDAHDAAVEYLKDADIVCGDRNRARFNLAVKGLILHYYDHRGDIITSTTVAEIPLGLRSLIVQLQATGLGVTT